MRIITTIIILFFNSCAGQKENLDYPKSINEILEVTLLRPDKETNGKFAEIKDLTEQEILQLLETLKNAKPVGPTKFLPDYYIIFTTRTKETKKIKIHGNKIKGYENDYSYEITDHEFLVKF